MTATGIFKVYVILGAFSGSLGISIDTDSAQDHSKFKYGYVVSHQEGSSQAHLESRNGNLALGRYYVNLPNGNGQKVTYFADDMGFHTGVSYFSQSGKGSSKTEIAMGHKALAAFGNSSLLQEKTIAGSTFAPQFGKKILKAVSPQPSEFPKLNYTPLPGGFYLTHESVDVSRNTTAIPSFTAGLTSQTISSYKDIEGKYSEGVLQSKLNTQTFYPTSENTKNEINQLHIQSTTPPIKTYTSIPAFSTSPGTNKFLQSVPSIDSFGYSKQKSIEKTNFEAIDAQIISEVQKHAEQIILKDLQRSKSVQNEVSSYSPVTQQFTTVTMQPIVVTDGGEYSINSIVSSTVAPEIRKSNKDFQSGSINAVRITEKSNNDQVLQDSGIFRVSLTPSPTSSVDSSPAAQQLIDVKSSDGDSVLNTTSTGEFNLCGETLTYSAQTEKKSDQVDVEVSDSKSNKIAFYPKNEISAERHYVTTIDVQKGISLDVQHNEDGSIQLAENFPFNKIRPYQNQNQYNHPTPRPLVSNEISVTPGIFAPETNLKLFSTPQKPYILNAVTAAPGLFDVTPNQNLGVVQGFNDVSPNPAQDRIENRPGYESQLVPPAPPIAFVQNQVPEDLSQVEKNIQDLRQQILSSIDAQHEQEQQKHGMVDEERRQYHESLKQVEALKGQNEVAYTLNVSPQPVVQPTAAPVSLEGKSSVEVAPETQYVQQPQISYQTELKDYNNQIPVVYSNVPQTNPAIYSKQVVAYNPQDFQALDGSRQLNFYPTQNVNAYSAGQQTVSEYSDKNVQQSAYINSNVQQNVPAYAAPPQQVVPGYTTNNIQQTVAYEDNNIQQTAPAYIAQKVETNNYPQIPPGALQPRYTAPAIPQNEEKPIQATGIVQGHINAVPISVVGSHVDNKLPEPSRTVLVNPVIPLDYSRLLEASLLQSYPISLQAKPQVAVPAVYTVPQTVSIPVQIPQTYKLATYADVPVNQNKRYHATLTQKPPNKLRVQPLKPSVPNEPLSRDPPQNLYSQSQLYRTYYYHQPSFYNNRLQLRHIHKNQISNSDQVPAQSLTRREKSLKNLRIEYGFKPPLRPSVEFTEEVKPSIYGSSVQPQ